MPFISDQEAEARIKSNRNLFQIDSELPAQNEPLPEKEVLSNLIIEPHRFRGRTIGATQVPEFLRPVVGAAGILSGCTETAKEFGLSLSTVSLASHGKVNNSNGPRERPDLQNKVNSIVGQVQEKAAERLYKALGFLDDEKLENARARDLSGIAADMSRIIEKTTPKTENQNLGTQILIYAPSLKSEEQFEVIEGL